MQSCAGSRAVPIYLLVCGLLNDCLLYDKVSVVLVRGVVLGEQEGL